MTQVIDFIGGEYRNRTGVHGFAIRCVTTPPTRLSYGACHVICRSGTERKRDESVGDAFRFRTMSCDAGGCERRRSSVIGPGDLLMATKSPSGTNAR